MPAKRHRTVDRVTRIIEVVSTRAGGITLPELARELDAPKSSVQGFVNGLVFAGYLAEHEHRFTLGGAPSVIGLRSNRVLAQTVRHDDLEALQAATGCNVLLGVRVGHHLVYIDEAGEGAPFEYVSRTRQNRPILATAAGKALLSSLGDDEMYGVLAELPDQDAVRAFLDEASGVRRDGYAVNRRSPSGDNYSAVARPVRDRGGSVLAAVTVAGPAEVVLRDQRKLAAALVEATSLWADREGTSPDG